MKHIKRILTITICFLIMLTSAFYSYTRIDSRCLVYADSTTDNWQNVTTNAQLVEAFRYYCKSRDLTIEGSVADAVTNFSTKTFNGICNTLGIDVTALQAHLKYETDGNLGTRFLFDTVGINAYNQIFAQFLQDNDLSVGDNNVNKLVQSEKYFTDYDGYTCAVYIVDSTSGSDPSSTGSNYIRQYGTKYRYSSDELYNLYTNGTRNLTFHLVDSTNTNCTLGYTDSYGIYWNIRSTYLVDYRRRPTGSYRYTWDGDLCIVYGKNDGNYYFGVCVHVTQDYGNSVNYYYIKKLTNTFVASNNVQDANVYIVSNVINNNNYEGDTIINNYGTPSDPNAPDDPDPDEPSYTPPDYPSEPTDDPSDWGVDLPDLDIPWFLRGKEDKFPWDIPYSMIVLLSVLNAEPEAPHIEGTLDLGVYEWNYELDLEQFDDVATICRNMMFIAFLFGLMLLTKQLIWG